MMRAVLDKTWYATAYPDPRCGLREGLHFQAQTFPIYLAPRLRSYPVQLHPMCIAYYYLQVCLIGLARNTSRSRLSGAVLRV